jgi:hypothetical protein
MGPGGLTKDIGELFKSFVLVLGLQAYFYEFRLKKLA